MSTPSSPPTGAPQPPRPGIPLPGSHLASQEPADPNRIRAEVDELLAELGPRPAATPAENTETGADITRRARILEQAHDVLVDALATVDKI
ncbi:hypothetical protein ACFXK0_27680 [Nocardia sp. NPDC059177]|uniref:hypothetical protein n=1 Tax=Nocardia sp. NPDC059177 TaxID=3346759 RepID=UPI0036790B91